MLLDYKISMMISSYSSMSYLQLCPYTSTVLLRCVQLYCSYQWEIRRNSSLNPVASSRPEDDSCHSDPHSRISHSVVLGSSHTSAWRDSWQTRVVSRSTAITTDYTVHCTLYSTVKCSTVTAQGAVLKHMPSWQLLELSVLVF